jgi:hypothetical protein
MVVADFFGKKIREEFISQAQSAGGKGILVTLFAVLLSINATLVYPAIVVAILLCTYLPRYRWHITALTTLGLFLLQPFWFNSTLPHRVAEQEGIENSINFSVLYYGMGLFYFALASMMIVCRRTFPQSWPCKRPIRNMLVFYFSMVILASQHLCHGLVQTLLWTFIDIFGGYFWFLCYALLDKSPAPSFLLQLGTFHPFWGSSTTPIGKGAANLRKMEAHDERGLAITRIKGIRLLIECVGLRIVLMGFQYLHSHLGMPTFEDAFSHQKASVPYAPVYCWGALIASFFEALLNMAIWGNTIIACARMAGFQLLRNTYKPLRSLTIADFWNRFYFYFKELLVECFFYPTFLTCFKRHKRLRIAFATFMAASVGNVIFHFMRDIEWVLNVGLWDALAGMQTYVMYSVLLAAGIIISQLGKDQSATRPRSGYVWLSSVRVMVFFCFIHIFDDMQRQRPLVTVFAFLLHLFGFNYGHA